MANVTEKGEPAGFVLRWRTRPGRWGRGVICHSFKWGWSTGFTYYASVIAEGVLECVALYCVFQSHLGVNVSVWKSDDRHSQWIWAAADPGPRQSEVSLSSLKTQRRRSFGANSGHLHVASFQTCSTKRGKLSSGAWRNRVHSPTEERLKWDHAWLHRGDFRV